ncbi:MAG: hypothetical protein M1839_009277 [Geoglossum umbratile]|nr:MAG: hypothetical protein M1839_009277 [Geoglossum umbratile]
MSESCRRSLALRRKLGPERYDTLRLASILAIALQKNDKAGSIELRREIVPKAQACYSTCMEQGDYEEAILAKEHEIYAKTYLYGTQDPETMKVSKEFALAARKQENMVMRGTLSKTF